MSTIKLVCMKSQPAPAAVKWKKIIQGHNFPLFPSPQQHRALLFPLNWKWKYSNGRNKLTANKPSNKNTSSNVLFVFSVVSCFHWLLLADTKHNLPFSETFCLLLQMVLFPQPSPLSAWWLVTSRSSNHSCCIPADESFVSAGLSRRNWSAVFQMHSWKHHSSLVAHATGAR